jgi:hypothetical protein
MHILINELSFIAQAKNVYEAADLMRTIVEILRELRPLQGSDLIYTHRTFSNGELSPKHTVHEWARTTTDRDTRRLFLVLAARGPFIDKVLDDLLEYHECHFNQKDVSTSSVAGAAYFKGALVSLQECAEFSSERIPVKFSTDGEFYEEIELPNLTEVEQVRQLRRQYAPSPKHQIGGWGTLMELEDDVAQIVLDQGIQSGKQVYGYHEGQSYVFQADNAGGYHGYPIDRNDVPATVLKQWDV